MTHSGGRPHTNVGDLGQRYEVRYTDDDGVEKVFGWTNEADGGALVSSIELNPSMHSPRVVDRQAGQAATPEHGEQGPLCGWCANGRQTWCSQCGCWSRTCCVEYGTCQCS